MAIKNFFNLYCTVQVELSVVVLFQNSIKLRYPKYHYTDKKTNKKPPNSPPPTAIKRKINKTLRNKGQIIQAHPNLHKNQHSL